MTQTTETSTITSVDELTPAIAAASTEKDTHVLVPNSHVDYLARLADQASTGDTDAGAILVQAFGRVFPERM